MVQQYQILYKTMKDYILMAEDLFTHVYRRNSIQHENFHSFPIHRVDIQYRQVPGTCVSWWVCGSRLISLLNRTTRIISNNFSCFNKTSSFVNSSSLRKCIILATSIPSTMQYVYCISQGSALRHKAGAAEKKSFVLN